MKKEVAHLAWSSFDGFVEYQPVFADGTVGKTVRTQITLADPSLERRKARLERELVGKEVEV